MTLINPDFLISLLREEKGTKTAATEKAAAQLPEIEEGTKFQAKVIGQKGAFYLISINDKTMRAKSAIPLPKDAEVMLQMVKSGSPAKVRIISVLSEHEGRGKSLNREFLNLKADISNITPSISMTDTEPSQNRSMEVSTQKAHGDSSERVSSYSTAPLVSGEKPEPEKIFLTASFTSALAVISPSASQQNPPEQFITSLFKILKNSTKPIETIDENLNSPQNSSGIKRGNPLNDFTTGTPATKKMADKNTSEVETAKPDSGIFKGPEAIKSPGLKPGPSTIMETKEDVRPSTDHTQGSTQPAQPDKSMVDRKYAVKTGQKIPVNEIIPGSSAPLDGAALNGKETMKGDSSPMQEKLNPGQALTSNRTKNLAEPPVGNTRIHKNSTEGTVSEPLTATERETVQKLKVSVSQREPLNIHGKLHAAEKIIDNEPPRQINLQNSSFSDTGNHERSSESNLQVKTPVTSSGSTDKTGPLIEPSVINPGMVKKGDMTDGPNRQAEVLPKESPTMEKVITGQSSSDHETKDRTGKENNSDLRGILQTSTETDAEPANSGITQEYKQVDRLKKAGYLAYEKFISTDKRATSPEKANEVNLPGYQPAKEITEPENGQAVPGSSKGLEFIFGKPSTATQAQTAQKQAEAEAVSRISTSGEKEFAIPEDKELLTSHIRTGSEGPQDKQASNAIRQLITHSDMLFQYQRHMEQQPGTQFFMFPIWFANEQGVGHWSYWKEEREGRDKNQGPISHLAFDLELTNLGQLNLHLAVSDKEIDLNLTAQKKALPFLKSGMKELQETLESTGFKLKMIEIFPSENAPVQGMATPVSPASFEDGNVHIVT